MSGHGGRDATASIWLAVDRVELPDKKYFKIGEVASLVGVEPHVLRYWQTQFPQVRPQKSRSGHRLYRKKDVETLLLVRELLHVQRFTIAGARQALRSLVRSERLPTDLPAFVEEAAPAPAPPARPFVAPPRAASTEVAAVEVEGLHPEELEDALARQLAASAGGPIASFDVEPGRDPGASRGRDAGLAPHPGPHPGAVSAPYTTPTASAAVPSSHAAPAPQPAPPPAPAMAASTPHERARDEQLGFGFLPSNREAIEAARAEVIAILNLLDREDAAAKRLRGRSVTAKS